MPYNPRTQDRSGEIWGRGMQSAASSITQALLGAHQQKQEAESLIELLGGMGVDEGALAGKGRKDLGELQGMLKAQLQERRDEDRGVSNSNTEARTRATDVSAAYTGELMDTLAEKRFNESTDRDALINAIGSGAGGEAMPDLLSTMVGQGGSPAGAGVSQVLQAVQANKQFKPEIFDLGEGREAMSTSGRSAVPLVSGKVDPVTQQVDVGGRQYTTGPGNKYFDETGKPVDFSPSVPRAPDPLTKRLDPELYEAQRAEYLDYINGRAGAGGGQGGGAAPVTITTREEIAKLPQGAEFIYNGKTYIKK